ncbi:MAG TPA: hypothetical protein VK745_12155 [Polyangiaceae bacterium]|jgi:hypothetical protein|nr:hypothetical protein [Polyangiaceae bacterium]
MGLFLRIFQHLLPTGAAWRLGFQKMLQKFFGGLANFFELTQASDSFSGPKDFADGVYGDLFPETTRELAEWEREFGLVADPSDSVRRLNLAAAWAATGGQSPAYIQGVLQTAGFPVYVHEFWGAFPPYIPLDPRIYTKQPCVGTFQCSPHSFGANQPQCTPTTIAGGPTCDGFLANDPGYLVNQDLTRRPPPPVPSNPALWAYFLYFSAATFGTPAIVPASRRAELERLVLKLKPAQQWVVMLVDYSADLSVTVGGVPVTVGGVPVLASS